MNQVVAKKLTEPVDQSWVGVHTTAILTTTCEIAEQ